MTYYGGLLMYSIAFISKMIFKYILYNTFLSLGAQGLQGLPGPPSTSSSTAVAENSVLTDVSRTG